MAVRPFFLEGPEREVAFVGFVGINVLSDPTAESEGHPIRRGPGNPWDTGPFACQEHVSRAIQTLIQVFCSSPGVFWVF